MHARMVAGARSIFVRCGLADSDQRFRRYPALPVLSCDGYSKLASGGEGTRRES